MQSYYSNPHQLQAAAVAAAAAAVGGQRLPFQAPFAGLHDPQVQSPHMRRLHGTTENSGANICRPAPTAPGSADEINESEMDSDIVSENDDDDANDNDSDKIESSSRRELISKLKRKEQDDLELEAEKGLEIPQKLSSHKRLRESHEENGCYGKLEDGGSGLEDDHTTTTTPQTEIKVQRPLGLLAQHGLTMKTALAKTHSAQSLQYGDQEQEEFDHRSDVQWEKEHKLQGSHDDLEQERQELERDKGSLAGLDFSNHMSLMDRRFMPSPSPLASPGGLDPNKPPSTPSGHHWTFEEQFKQLYEMSPESKRREFLDDLFTFMQKRGTPVNRIPIMAKQTLDLYELFRLVVSKGGLVEVINKKLWREITKGLNLPSSITSAAFTLRTQYMKYLYPYECDKLKLSTLAELQSAIDGNRREGRRPGYGYDFSPIPTMLHTPPTPHLNGSLHPLVSTRPPTGLSPKDDDRSILQSSHNHLRSLAAEHDARAMEVATRAMEDLVNKRMEEVSRAAIASNVMTTGSISASSINSATKFDDMPSCKRPTMFDDERFLAHMGMHSTHIKLNSRNNGRLEYDSSMVVSMEINGMMYQGVLFAQHPRRI